MRCPAAPCQHEGQYCWQDPIGRKHYQLETHHLRTLAKYVEQGGILEFHGDIPDNVREQLYGEERQRLLKQNKSTNSVAPGSILLQINIIVLLSQLSQPAGSSSRTSEPAPNLIGDDLNDVPGLLEAAVGEYGTWHPSRASQRHMYKLIAIGRTSDCSGGSAKSGLWIL